MVELTGYHGTLDFKAKQILKEEFIPSDKNNEWLGFGIYFFTKYSDAKSWAQNELNKEKYKNKGYNPAVLKAIVNCEEELYYDLDIKENLDRMMKETLDVIKGLSGRNSTKLTDAQMRCAACNWFAKKHKVKVYNFTFPRKYYNEIGFPTIVEQQQFCVRDHKLIKKLSEC